MVMQNPAVTLQ